MITTKKDTIEKPLLSKNNSVTEQEKAPEEKEKEKEQVQPREATWQEILNVQRGLRPDGTKRP